ncbi:SRPBCC family protein [Xanthomonas maliensis]|uniref:SRPBCC family protein n=1 Tax=Xanthomonas maliensis TaxID=1321368 RepID=UPI0003AAEB05|nr:SRPBCC domain-containing protein [Xanthomonas maliensis]KAB7768867.1 SRPBCC domain-containing protein [Xanthomonas maliensis]
MNEIRHSSIIAAAPEVVSAALTEPAQLARWWTREVRREGQQIRLDWPHHGWWAELILDAGADHRLACWRCRRADLFDSTAWAGTVLRFALVSIGQGTRVDLVHSSDCAIPALARCARSWRLLLDVSLKRHVELGHGLPYPDILAICAPATG